MRHSGEYHGAPARDTVKRCSMSEDQRPTESLVAAWVRIYLARAFPELDRERPSLSPHDPAIERGPRSNVHKFPLRWREKPRQR
jgi:hypothetical protein